MVNPKPLMNIKKAIEQLKIESRGMDIRTALLRNQITQSKMTNKYHSIENQKGGMLATAGAPDF